MFSGSGRDTGGVSQTHSWKCFSKPASVTFAGFALAKDDLHGSKSGRGVRGESREKLHGEGSGPEQRSGIGDGFAISLAETGKEYAKFLQISILKRRQRPVGYQEQSNTS